MTSVLEATVAASLETGRIDRCLSTPNPWGALVQWLGLGAGDAIPSSREMLARLTLDVAAIDDLLGDQVDTILHHPALQALEASWRGLGLLTQEVEPGDNVKIRFLDASWADLSKDFERAIEFDQSQIFQKVYTQEFGMPGGEPFGVLLGNYDIQHRRSPSHPNDLGILRSMAQVAAASFAPFICSAHPTLFGLETFADLERPIDLARTFASKEYTSWNSLRSAEDSRFVGITLPRILMRLPYRDDPMRADGFRYVEDVSASDRSGYLWGSAIYAFGEVLIRAFVQHGWMAAIRGVQRDIDGGGLVTHLVRDSFETDRRGLATKGSLEVQLTDHQEQEFGELGFIPLAHCHGTGFAAFYGNQSIQRWNDPEKGSASNDTVSVNAKLSSMLQYMFCVSRFAHYVKILAREKTGSYTTASEIQSMLSSWLVQYATANQGTSAEIQAKYPLRDTEVHVRELPGRPGVFSCTVHLRPHFQLDEITASVKLVTELYAGHNI